MNSKKKPRGDAAHSPRPSAFARYDAARFAVILNIQGSKETLQGTAHFERDEDLGNILRITLDGSQLGNPELIIVEEEWSGLILPDHRFGCDFCLFQVTEEKSPRRNGEFGSRSRSAT